VSSLSSWAASERLQGAQVRVIRAQKVGQHPRVKRITLGRTLPEPIPGPVLRLGIDGVDDDAMVKQEIKLSFAKTPPVAQRLIFASDPVRISLHDRLLRLLSLRSHSPLA
jgi:hypothetical protein